MNSENHLFIERNRCPICSGNNTLTLLEVSYKDESFKKFLNYERTYTKNFNDDYERYKLEDHFFSISECQDCLFIFQRHVLNDTGMQLLYSRWIDPIELNKIRVQNSTNINRRKMQRSIEIGMNLLNNKKNLKALDWGAGTGEFCKVMTELNLETYAFEYSEQRKIELQKLGIGTFSKETLPECFFDIIICNQVLEHVLDPLETLAAIKNKLKMGGLLFLSTPSCTTVKKLARDKNLNRDFFMQLSPHQHINAFNNSTLKNICYRIGFRPIVFNNKLLINLLHHINTNSIKYKLLSPVYNYFFGTSLFFKKNNNQIFVKNW